MNWLAPVATGTLLALFSAHAFAQQARTAVGVLASHETLSNGSADWSETGLRLAHTLDKRYHVEASMLAVRRFGLDDDQLRFAGSLTLSPSISVSMEADASSTHRVLPEHTLGATVALGFAPAWLLHVGGRTSSYSNTSVDQGILMIERYVGDFSILAGVRPTRALDRHTSSQELRANWYYTDRNRVGLSFAWGTEATSLPDRVLLANVRALTLLGRYQFDPAWSLDYAAGVTRQGDLYTRRGASLGLSRQF